MSLNSKKIRIAHIHVWDTDNKGDFAIVLAVQELLRKTFGECEIQDFPMEVLKKPSDGDLQVINNCNIVVIGAAGVYYKWFLPFDTGFIGKIVPPIAIFGVGHIREIGSNDLDDVDKESLRILNNTAKLVSVRDYETKRYLESIGVNETAIRVIGDAAVLLEEKSSRLEIRKDRRSIGINLNYSGWLGFGKYEDVILDSYRRAIAILREHESVDVYYLLHHPGERNIVDKLGIDMIIVDLPPNEQKHFYSKLDLVIGMMLHSVVLAFGAGTPEINVGYDIRNRSFAEFIGFPELHVPADELEPGVFAAHVLDIFKRRNSYREKFGEVKSRIRQLQEGYLQEVKKLV